MAEKRDDLEAEYVMESLAEDKKTDTTEDYIVKQPVLGTVLRRGAAVLRGTTRCGKVSYFLHWDPAAVQGQCELHSECYATWPLATSPDEALIVDWVASAPSFKNARDHMKTLPAGWYNHRLKLKSKA